MVISKLLYTQINAGVLKTRAKISASTLRRFSTTHWVNVLIIVQISYCVMTLVIQSI